VCRTFVPTVQVAAGAAYLFIGTLLATAGPETDAVKVNRVTAPVFPPLPGKVVGVLTADIQRSTAAEGRIGPPNAIGFVAGPGSYRWLYLRNQGKSDESESVTVPVGPEAEKKRFTNVRLTTVDDLKRLGEDAYALVVVEVNEGLGSPKGADSFVASTIRRIDGGDGYPFNVGREVANLRDRYQTNIKNRSSELAAALEKLAREVLGTRPMTGPRETETSTYVTWLADQNRLRIDFRTRVTDGAFGYGSGIEQGTGRAGAPADKRGARFGTLVGVEAGEAFEVSPTGKVERDTPLPLRTFTYEFPRPRSAR